MSSDFGLKARQAWDAVNYFSDVNKAARSNFWQLKSGGKAATIAATALVALLTLGVGAAPMFKKMTSHFSACKSTEKEPELDEAAKRAMNQQAEENFLRRQLNEYQQMQIIKPLDKAAIQADNKARLDALLKNRPEEPKGFFKEE